MPFADLASPFQVTGPATAGDPPSDAMFAKVARFEVKPTRTATPAAKALTGTYGPGERNKLNDAVIEVYTP
jgi:hypothetical protein